MSIDLSQESNYIPSFLILDSSPQKGVSYILGVLGRVSYVRMDQDIKIYRWKPVVKNEISSSYSVKKIFPTFKRDNWSCRIETV